MAAEGDAAQGEADMEEGGPPAADSRALARAMAELRAIGIRSEITLGPLMLKTAGRATGLVRHPP